MHSDRSSDRRSTFGDDAVASCHLAEVDGEIAAMALWFRTFSTWDGVAGSTWRICSSGPASAAGAWPARCWPRWRQYASNADTAD